MNAIQTPLLGAAKMLALMHQLSNKNLQNDGK
ncbi:hypothetical protein HNP99_003029 [Flavobacterium sp. 28A]|nr:hypothetical protein [Flavobacterium sp. 28A]